ncbi:TPA: hypothetical protein ACSTJ2_000195 [Serratia fonticola]
MTTITEITKAEKIYKENLLKLSSIPVSRRNKLAMEGVPAIPAFTPLPESTQIPNYMIYCPVDTRVYKKIWKNLARSENTVTTVDNIINAKAYVSELLGDGLLDNVGTTIVANNLWDIRDSVEGYAITCGEDEHHIFVPQLFSSPTELLCHELAHTAHYTAQRRSHKYSSYFTRYYTAELVAHYVQFNYILTKMSAGHLYAAIPQLVQATYAHSIVQHSLIEANGNLVDYKTFITSESAKYIRDGWRKDVLRDVYPTFIENSSHLQHYYHRSLGMIWALILLGEHEGMRKFIHADDGESSLEDMLHEAFPHIDLRERWEDFSNYILEVFSKKKFK